MQFRLKPTGVVVFIPFSAKRIESRFSGGAAVLKSSYGRRPVQVKSVIVRVEAVWRSTQEQAII